MSNAGAASLAALIPARAAASRRNGAKSKGPKTAEGKARSARNALKHGLRAERFVVLGDEDLAEFDALEAALMAELVPQGALQAVLARRIVASTWRLERAERIEAELFAENAWGTASFGLAMIRDCNNPRAFDTLLRYRGGTLAEFWRALRTLKALQAEAAAAAPDPDAAEHAQGAQPNEPETRTNAEDSRADQSAASPVPDRATPSREAAPAVGAAADAAPAARSAAPGDRAAGSSDVPNEPKARINPGKIAIVRDRTRPPPGDESAPSMAPGMVRGALPSNS